MFIHFAIHHALLQTPRMEVTWEPTAGQWRTFFAASPLHPVPVRHLARPQVFFELVPKRAPGSHSPELASQPAGLPAPP
jgi:hypothetical protein